MRLLIIAIGVETDEPASSATVYTSLAISYILNRMSCGLTKPRTLSMEKIRMRLYHACATHLLASYSMLALMLLFGDYLFVRSTTRCRILSISLGGGRPLTR